MGCDKYYLIMNQNLISGKYFILKNDNRFPLSLPTGQWQNFEIGNFYYPKGCSIYLLSGNNNLYVGSDGNGRRVYDHKSALKCNYHENHYMQNVANKYGLEIFYYQPLVEIPQEYVIYRDQIENSYIKLFDTYHNGYNLCEFADTPQLGRKASEETKKKLSESHKGQVAWNKGIPQTDEQKQHHSKVLKERYKSGEIVSWNKGKKHNKKTKIKISKANKGKHYSLETEFKKGFIPWNKDKNGIHLSPATEFKKGIIPKNRKKVICLETRKIYISMTEAAKDMNLNSSGLNAHLKSKNKSFAGFHWDYIKY